jgi:hypothetical protein
VKFSSKSPFFTPKIGDSNNEKRKKGKKEKKEKRKKKKRKKLS